jgi:hypothetical protein
LRPYCNLLSSLEATLTASPSFAAPDPNNLALGLPGGAFRESAPEAGLVTFDRGRGGGHASGQSGFIHFGIGAAERIEVRVQWPDGEWGPWLSAFTNQFLRIDRGREVVRYWMPAEHASDE